MNRRKKILLSCIDGFKFVSNSKDKTILKKRKRYLQKKYPNYIYKIKPFGVKLINVDKYGSTFDWKKKKGFSLWCHTGSSDYGGLQEY